MDLTNEQSTIKCISFPTCLFLHFEQAAFNRKISFYHRYSCKFESRLWRGVLITTLCDKVSQWLVAGRWFSLGTTVSSTNKTDCHDIAEILLKVAFNTIILNPSTGILVYYSFSIYEWIRCGTIKNIKYFSCNLTDTFVLLSICSTSQENNNTYMDTTIYSCPVTQRWGIVIICCL